MIRKTPPGTHIGNGIWVERDTNERSDNPRDGTDIVYVPSLGDDWKYELWSCNKHTDDQIKEIIGLYQFGVGKGIDIGRNQYCAEMRKALGLDTPAIRKMLGLPEVGT